MRSLSGARVLAAVVLLVAIAWTGASPALAEPPVDVTGQITDPDGVLGDRTDDVQAALDAYFEETRSQLFVVFVGSFDDEKGQAWADASATRSGLGAGDILLAVATDDRAYGLSIDDRNALTDDDLEQVERDDILPRLRVSDWAGAAVAAAEGYTEASQGSDLPWLPIAIGGAVAVGGGAYAVHRIRRRYDSTHVVRDEHGDPVDPLSILSTEELDQRCGSALVAVDDAVKTSEQELAYAEAQFGREATRPFAEALAEARGTVKAAFGLKQKLDDDDPETEQDHRRTAAEIIRLGDHVDQTLDEQVEAFDRLRDLQARAPEVLADLAVRATEVERRLAPARATLELLQRTHPATDLASVSGNVDQALQLVADAEEQCTKGQESLAADDRATAVVRARAAEDAIAQATRLLDAIDRADADLAAAPGLIAARLASIGQDVSDAQRLAPQDPAVVAAVEAAQQAVAYAGRPDHDPLAAAGHLQNAEAALDDLLGPARAAAAEAEKARVALTDSLGRITSRVRAVTDYVSTRRGAVGPEARTRLSEATRHLDRAQQLLETDPGTALTALRSAEQYVDEAERLARADVDRWEQDRRPNRSSRTGVDSMILGGILFDQLGRGRSGGLGGLAGRGGGGAGVGPGSFGGTSTRGRRGGGGRF